ncbi:MULTISPECIES: DUF5655 domain-containing protein [Chryseobacterium]|uniref:Transport protein n=1 Tax=Chryseobacterium geocarposphaerae TaxID=1416776 RepID=A0ABU1L970_9FLAO|nr:MULTISPECIES: DUF5655 domain-containing protein [Chryseobacterium]MDR6403253.1 putative transport protein [Chryseobacterium geocarposphaerae]MDR6696807.1 putative transport protein [Chryseobacterium ginsenosidimutans]
MQQNDNSEISKVIKEIKVYIEEDHLQGKSDNIKELYDSFKNDILNLSPDIEIDPKKLYIAFKRQKNIVDFLIQNKSLKMWINLKKGYLKDEKKIAKDVSDSGHWGNGDYEIVIF